MPDRRHGSGGAAKPKQKEAEPVSPPRQSVIAAAHNAEIGSQIKVKFDTGHWYSGTILKVDPQRCGWFDWLVRIGFVKVLWLCVSAGKVTRLVDANLLPYRSTSCSCVWSRQCLAALGS